MARPKGSRKIGGWTYTPAQMEASGLLPSGSTVTKQVTQSDGSTITRTDVKSGVDPLNIFKGKTTEEKSLAKKSLRQAKSEEKNATQFKTPNLSDKEIEKLKPRKTTYIEKGGMWGTNLRETRADVYADAFAVSHFKGAAGANYKVGLWSKNDFLALNVGRSDSGSRATLGMFKTQRQAKKAIDDLIRAKIDWNNPKKEDRDIVRGIFEKHQDYR